MNKVILMGRPTRDPEVRYTQGERSIAIARYTLAVDRRGRRDQNGSQPSADFIQCVAFGRNGEFAEKYIRQGQRVLIEGHIQTGSYTNRDGQKVYTTEVVVETQEFADSKRDDTQSARQRDIDAAQKGSYRDDQGKYHDGYGSYDSQKQADEGFMNIPDGVEDEGLPFS